MFRKREGDPFDQDPQFKRVMEEVYRRDIERQIREGTLQGEALSFDEFWDRLDDEGRWAHYDQVKSNYREYLKGLGKKKNKKDTPPDPADVKRQAKEEAASYGVPEKDVHREKVWVRDFTDPVTGEKVPGHWEVIEKETELAPAALRLRTLGFQIAEETLEQRLKDAKRAEKIKKMWPAVMAKDFITEVGAGTMQGALKGLSTNRQAMAQAKEVFVPSDELGGMAPAPRSRFTSPQVAQPPARMPVARTASGQMPPAGRAIVGGSPKAAAAMIAPSPAGKLVTVSVNKNPAAQALMPSRARMDLNLGGLREASVTKPRVKKNLYNVQFKRIRRKLSF